MDVLPLVFFAVVLGAIIVLAWVFTNKRKDDDIPIGPLPPIPMPNDPSKPGPGVLVPDDPIYKPEIDEVANKVVVKEVPPPAPCVPTKVEEKVKPKPKPGPKRNKWPPPKKRK